MQGPKILGRDRHARDQLDIAIDIVGTKCPSRSILAPIHQETTAWDCLDARDGIRQRRIFEMIDSRLAAFGQKGDVDHVSAHPDIAAEHGACSARTVGIEITLASHPHCRPINERQSDGHCQPLAAGRCIQVLSNLSPEARQCAGESGQMLLLAAQPSGLPIRVVDVLHPSRLIGAAALDVRMRFWRNANLPPRWRNTQLTRPRTQFRIENRTAFCIDQPKAAPMPPVLDGQRRARHPFQPWHFRA